MSRVSAKTVFLQSRRIFLAAGALCLLTSGTLPSSEVGGPEPLSGRQEPSAAWSKLCFDALYVRPDNGGRSESPAAPQSVEACYTYLGMPNEPAGISIAALGVLQAQALNRTLLVAVLPLQAEMNPQPGYLLFQDGTRIKLAYLPRNACDRTGCYARAELSEGLLERIKVAKALSFGEDTRERSYSVPLAPGGFAEVFAAAPVFNNSPAADQRPAAKAEVFGAAPAINDSSAVNQRQAAQEALRRKFLDFIQ